MAQLNKRDWRDVWRFIEEFPIELEFEGTLNEAQSGSLDTFGEKLDEFFDACVAVGLAFDRLAFTSTGYQEVQ